MSNFFVEIGKPLLEWQGRGKPAPRYIFQENEIVSPGYPRNVSPLWQATYIRLHPTHYAVAIGPTGRLINLTGGYNLLPTGRYIIHYVDKQSRVNLIPKTSEITADGFQIAMELAINYRVIDPIKALEVQNPIDMLLRLLQANLKEFIRSHKYDEIMGDANGQKIDNEQVVIYIREQHIGSSPLARLFYIVDVVVKEKVGDPKVIELREKYQISQRQLDNQKALQTMNQELEKKVVDQDALIKKIKAESAVTQQNIVQKMEMQKIALEKARADFQYRQENWRVAVDAIVQTLSNQTYPPDSAEYEVIKELLMELRASTLQSGETAAAQGGKSPNGPPKGSDRINELTRTLLNWRRPTPPP